MAVVTVITPPSITPISLATAKLHLKVDFDDDDTLISTLIDTATEWCQSRVGQQFITATRRLYLDGFPSREIVLPYPPAATVTSITYIDIGGTTRTWTSTLYQTDLATKPARIRPAWSQVWPSTRGDLNSVIVNYTCGYGATAASVPAPIRQAMLLLVGHLYENRESTSEANLKEVPGGVESLLMSQWHGEMVFAGGDQ